MAQELERRTDLGLKIIVVDSEKGDRKKQIEEAEELAKNPENNVLIIANYEAVQDFPDAINKLTPQVQIIDEEENLKGGEDTKWAPIIFGIRTKYRIAITARPVVNSKDDVVELLLWARHHTYLPEGKDVQEARNELKNDSADALFIAMDPVKVRWRRKTVMPEVKEPIEETEYIELSPKQEKSCFGNSWEFY